MSSKKKSKKKEVFKNTLVLREDLIYLIENQAIEFNDKSTKKWLKDLNKSTQKYIKIDLSQDQTQSLIQEGWASQLGKLDLPMDQEGAGKPTPINVIAVDPEIPIGDVLADQLDTLPADLSGTSLMDNTDIDTGSERDPFEEDPSNQHSPVQVKPSTSAAGQQPAHLPAADDITAAVTFDATTSTVDTSLKESVKVKSEKAKALKNEDTKPSFGGQITVRKKKILMVKTDPKEESSEAESETEGEQESEGETKLEKSMFNTFSATAFWALLPPVRFAPCLT